MTSPATLTSLAMLKVRRDHEGTDYLDYLVPFVSYVISRSSGDGVTSAAVQFALRTEFGLCIPLRPVELVLSRLVKRGSLVREYGMFRVVGNLPIDSFEIRRAEARRRQQVVIAHLLMFAQSSGITWTEEQATDAFIRYLSRYSIHCLKAYASGSALPEVPKHGAAESYVVNAFIRNAHTVSTQLFDDIMVFVESQMLANALICNDLQANNSRFSDVTFFLDTPLLIGLLGLDGPEREALGIELLQLVRNLKGRIAVFQHTAEELDQVLAGCIQRFAAPHVRSRIVLYFRRSGKTATDLEITRGSIDERLRDLRIQVVPTPKHLIRFQIDESVLQEAIGEEIEYFTVRALHYDVESIRSVYTLRQGTHATSVERSRAVLVTSNATLARVAYKYGRDHESSREVSTVITEMSLAAIAWLKAPMGAPALPRLEVLSACYAAMKPSRVIFEKFINEIDRLRNNSRITVAQHELLRCSVAAHDELMRLTMGDESRFSGHTVVEVLESAEKEIAERERKKFDVERQQLVAATKSLIDDTAAHQEKLENERQLHGETRAELERLRNRETERKKRTFWAAGQCARWIRIVALTVLVGLALLNFIAPLMTARPGLIRQTVSALLLVSACWDFVRRIWGANALAVTDRLEDAVSSRLFRLFLLLQGLEVADPGQKSATPHKAESEETASGADVRGNAVA